jgi:uncharacterized protein (TIGR02284 family)
MVLANDKIIEACSELIRVDLEAIEEYDAAIQHIEEEEIVHHLKAFRHDHARHVEELSQIVRRLGVTPPEKAGAGGKWRSVKTKMAGAMGTESALKSMRKNEELTNKQYGEQASQPFPEAVLEVVQRNYRDEQRHLAWIEKALNGRIWEKQPAHP